MMAIEKILMMGSVSECKWKWKVPKLRLDVGEKNAQKDEECISNMEQDVVAFYVKDVFFFSRGRLSGLK